MTVVRNDEISLASVLRDAISTLTGAQALEHLSHDELLAHQWPSTLWDDHQRDIIMTILDDGVRELYIKGASRVGKGAAVAAGACLYFWRYDDARIIVTSSSYQHACDVMFAEIKQWFRAMQDRPVAKVLQQGIDGGTAVHQVIVANPQTDEGFAGRHGQHTLIVFDEATAVPASRYLLANTQATKFVALGNPRVRMGPFYDGFALAEAKGFDLDANLTLDADYGRRRLITVDGARVVNVRERRTVIPGILDYDRFMGHLRKGGFWAQTFAHGRFPREDTELQLIVPSWLARHHERWQQLEDQEWSGIEIEAAGLDIAASEDGDETVLAVGGQWGVRAIHVQRFTDAMSLAGWVIGVLRKVYGINPIGGTITICVDSDGVGWGIGSRLKELGVRVVEHHGAASPSDRHTYRNMRAETWGELARRLDPTGTWKHEPYALPFDERLREELVAPERIYGSDGRYSITPKDRAVGSGDDDFGHTLRAKLRRSPDRGDAVAYQWRAARDRAHNRPADIGFELHAY